jgi:dsRNA-specific ribonuclease
MSSVAAEHIVGYNFTRRDLLAEALDTSGDRNPESNQRLAMLGDALLQIILLDAWYASGNTKGTLVTS